MLATPFADPHAPLTLIGAVQDTAAPPFMPEHVHVHGPPPLTLEAWPMLHRSICGASRWPEIVAPPQTASRFGDTEHKAAAPPYMPEQVQFHGPLPVIALA